MGVSDWFKKTPKETGRDKNTAKENELLDVAQARFEAAKAGKVDMDGRDLHSKWKRLDEVYRGKQWGAVPEGKSAPVLNYVFSLVESTVPRLTDIAPEITVMPRRDPETQELADALTTAQKYLWDVNEMRQKSSEGTRLCLKFGTAIYKAYWDWDRYDGLGDVAYSVVHPMNFFPDPRAYNIKQMDYCFTKTPTSLEYIKRRFKDKGHLVAPDSDWGDTENSPGQTEELYVSLMEYWFRDEAGNMCVMYYAGDIVLDIIGGEYDGSNEPVYRHNRFPFERQLNYPVDKQFWGLSEIEIIENIQRLVNSFEAQIIDNTRLLANGIWKVNKKLSGLTEDDAWIFDNTPGSVYFTMDGGVEREPGVPIPPHVTAHQERLIFSMEQILGIHDVVQGRKPSGVRAASAIIALQEAANVRVRQKAREMEYTFKQLADMANWLVLEFYNEPRRLRVTGANPYVTLDVHTALEHRMTEVAGEMGMVEPGATPETLRASDQLMGTDQMGQIMKEVRFPEFDIEVKVGPSVPYSQALLYQQALEFYQAGIIDRQAVLDTVGFPKREEILERMAQQERAAAEAAAQQQQAPPGVQL